MRLARISAAPLALALASALSACGDARDVTEARAGGQHPIPFVAEHTAAARASIQTCRVCHGSDFGGGAAQSCTACHRDQLGFDASDWRTNCTFCHGTRDESWGGDLAQAAPPPSADGAGAQDPTNPSVGAHQAHLTAGRFSAPIACEACHSVPPQTFPGSLAHVNGTPDVEFSTTARRGVASPGYAGAGGTCAVYCHGSIAALGNRTSPAWTSEGEVACGVCHSLSPTSGGDFGHGFHLGRNVACEKCHVGYPLGEVVTATHVNGTFEATIAAGPFTRSATVGPSTTPTWPAGSCTAVCHTSIPPL
jgi:predicted CxxxxCH...CXXCH cytochrome family protein